MKKTIILTLVVAFALTGCFKKDKVVSPEDVVKETAEKKELSLKEWFRQGKGVECVVKSEEGDIVTYSQGDKVKMNGIGFGTGAEDGSMISDGEWTYMWSGTEGTKMNIKELDEMAGDATEEEAEELDDWESNIEDWDETGVDYDCQERKFDKDFFTPPANVTFTDMGAIFSEAFKSGEEMEQKFNSGEDVDMNSLEDMRKALDEMNLGQ